MESSIDWKVGDACVICDYSEAHGDKGVIYFVQTNGIILVELDECIWPVEVTGIKHTPAIEACGKLGLDNSTRVW
jgi:hypothetical protein